LRCGAIRMTPSIIIKITGNGGRCFLWIVQGITCMKSVILFVNFLIKPFLKKLIVTI